MDWKRKKELLGVRLESFLGVECVVDFTSLKLPLLAPVDFCTGVCSLSLLDICLGNC